VLEVSAGKAMADGVAAEAPLAGLSIPGKGAFEGEMTGVLGENCVAAEARAGPSASIRRQLNKRQRVIKPVAGSLNITGVHESVILSP